MGHAFENMFNETLKRGAGVHETPLAPCKSETPTVGAPKRGKRTRLLSQWH
jgi:hypothetical protein